LINILIGISSFKAHTRGCFIRKKIVALTMGFLSLGAILATTVASQDYPAKPLEIICPYAPGGSIDSTARQIANVGPKHVT
jgi:tripartite-type tricarboxylate transporter receptor subunit TctC